ncbi:MAG: hypothetical protein AB7O73_15740 [Bacteroidia bacterium]
MKKKKPIYYTIANNSEEDIELVTDGEVHVFKSGDHIKGVLPHVIEYLWATSEVFRWNVTCYAVYELPKEINWRREGF